jgi:predicted Rossmann fold nucleotide-binding protein DprA/Smf involved in DNA uptake
MAELPEHFSARVTAKAPAGTEVSLSELERVVIDSLSFEQPRHVDQIAGITGGRSQDLLSALVSLELKNYITQMPGKHFLRLR